MYLTKSKKKKKAVINLNQSIDTGLGQIDVFQLVNVHLKALHSLSPVSTS